MEPQDRNLRDYLAIIRRRKLAYIMTFGLVFFAAVALAIFWPPTYQSDATILIEEPDVPRDLVSSTITSFADQRLQVITQQVMTTKNLIDIINKFDLYAKERQRAPMGLVVQDMREEIGLDIVNAEVVDPRSGRPTQSTIAFTLSFENRNPSMAQRVLGELVSLYLSENLRTRREKASETTQFLANERSKLSTQISRLSSRLAEFKSKHAGSLPEQQPINDQVIDRTERELLEVRRQDQALEERKIFLEAELAQIDPFSDSGGSFDRDTLTPEQRLQLLTTEHVGKKGIYGEKHPDVVRLAREITALELELGKVADMDELHRQLENLRTEMALAQNKYSDSHPDVVRLKRRVSVIENSIVEAESAPNPTQQRPSNPAFIQIRAQLEAVKSERNSLAVQREALDEKLQQLDQHRLAAPQIEQEYRLLHQEYEQAVNEYQNVQAKLSAAEIGEALETERKGERFSLIEPPSQPLEPVSPNRWSIIVLGFVLSVSLGAGSVALFEAVDQTVYGPKQLAAIVGSAPLVVIPYIRNEADKKRRLQWASATAIAFFMIVSVTIYYIQNYYIPLDVLWSIAERKLSIYFSAFGA